MICKKSGWTGEFPTCEGEDTSQIGASWKKPATLPGGHPQRAASWDVFIFHPLNGARRSLRCQSTWPEELRLKYSRYSDTFNPIIHVIDSAWKFWNDFKREERVYSGMILKKKKPLNHQVCLDPQRGRPPVPPLRSPTLSTRLERWSERAAAWTSPAAKVSSWTELSRSPVVQTASGDLCPPSACPHTFPPSYPIKTVSSLFCRLISIFLKCINSC